jgi:hypothetical protein
MSRFSFVLLFLLFLVPLVGEAVELIHELWIV